VAADTPQALAATASAVSPGFAAVCLSHTHPAYAAAVRSALADTRTPVVDTTSHAHAVAIAAATLNALRHKGVRLPEARVVLAGASRCAYLAGVLLTLGIRSLTFHGTGTPGEHHGQDTDVIVDPIGQPATKDGPPVLRACPQDLPPLQTTNRHPHPLHALPALLITAARARRLSPHHLRAAAAALADLAGPGQLLPAVGESGLAQQLATALSHHRDHPTDV